MWKELGFPKPFNTTPILFLDVSGEESWTPLQSWTNAAQSEAAITIARTIQTHSLGKVTTLCYYNSTLRDLKAHAPNLPCNTVDCCMGKRTDILILLTTRTNTHLTEETAKFFFDRNRLTVALTRTKKGIIIVGSQTVLKNSPLWRKLFIELCQRISIVSLDEFVDYLKS